MRSLKRVITVNDMSQAPTLPDSEEFAATVRLKMESEGRKWSWLSEASGINAGPLQYQLVKNPRSLKLHTAKRVASALAISFWGEAA